MEETIRPLRAARLLQAITVAYQANQLAADNLVTLCNGHIGSLPDDRHETMALLHTSVKVFGDGIIKDTGDPETTVTVRQLYDICRSLSRGTIYWPHFLPVD